MDDQSSQLKEENLPKLEESYLPSTEPIVKREPPEHISLINVPSMWNKSNATNVEVPSLKEIGVARDLAKTNESIRDWCQSVDGGVVPGSDICENVLQNVTPFPEMPSKFSKLDDVEIDESPVDDGADDGLSITENKISNDETYYDVSQLKMPLNDADLALIIGRRWLGAPTVPQITSTTYQQETSNESIMRYNREADALSICSRAASWGTIRRNSNSSIVDGNETDETSGTFLKRFRQKQSDRGTNFSLLGAGLDRLAKFARHLSDGKLKRKTAVDSSALNPNNYRSWSADNISNFEKSLNSFSKLPSLEEIYESRVHGTGIDAEPRTKAIWSTPFRTDYDSALGQVSTPATSVREEAKTNNEESDSDEGVDIEEPAPVTPAESIMPNYDGFKAHIRHLNPAMDPKYNWLVSRIAHQQEVRYKSLLDLRLKHNQAIRANSCSSGNKCLALGGRILRLDMKGKNMQKEGNSALSAQQTPISSDEDSSDCEGKLTHESFPAIIPMPPTKYVPAEFECQFCYRTKRILKPSDWIKHVHEDVQPYTCTFDKCKEPKSFKRKADWVRHENERHRHLEWWVCQVNDCNHPCYRKDNFLQHLVREHKLPEPKQITRTAIKKARLTEPVWIMLDKCHHETQQKPQDEPCKFCGKIFPTWKKLTVHLAKHMEHISLPIIALTQAKSVDADTAITPVGEERYAYPGGYPSPASTASPFAYADPGISTAASSPYSMQYSATHAPMLRQQMAQSGQFKLQSSSHGFQQPVRTSWYAMAPPQTYTPMDSGQMDSGPNMPMPLPSNSYQPPPMFVSQMDAMQPGAPSMYSTIPTMQNTSLSAFGPFPVATSQGDDLETTVAVVSEALGESKLY